MLRATWHALFRRERRHGSCRCRARAQLPPVCGILSDSRTRTATLSPCAQAKASIVDRSIGSRSTLTLTSSSALRTRASRRDTATGPHHPLARRPVHARSLSARSLRRPRHRLSLDVDLIICSPHARLSARYYNGTASPGRTPPSARALALRALVLRARARTPTDRPTDRPSVRPSVRPRSRHARRMSRIPSRDASPH